MNKQKFNYIAPTADAIEVKVEGVICGSIETNNFTEILLEDTYETL